MVGDHRPGFEIRSATAEDIPALTELEIEAGQRFADIGLEVIAADDPPTAEEFRPAIDDGRLVVAVLGQQLVGYAWWSELDGDAHLEQVSVATTMAGHGLGRTLIDHVCAEARRRRLPAMTLTTFRDVAWNGPLYERYGFTTLDDSMLSPGLVARRRQERELGLDVVPRVAMVRPLNGG